ncbi:unnamed protein product [Closterium sp. Yama58-4]|nr:unnamed protein product [Closterium sp. Yama58-4]
MYALPTGTEGDCYLCVLPDPGIEAAALGASAFALFGIEAAALGASESALFDIALAEALHTFTLASVLARSSTVLPCPAVTFGSLIGLHIPSFSTNLVSTAVLQDAGVKTFTPGGQRVTICTCARTGRHLATFTRWPGSSLYTLTTEPPQVAASGQVSASGQLSAPCSCRLLSHQTVLWHHHLGHPSLPRLRGMHSRLLVSGLPRSLAPLPHSPAPPCLPCVEGRQRTAPHSSSFPPMTAPLQTLHMDVWGPARVSGQGRERYFLLVVDDYSRYITVFPLRSKEEVPPVLIPWIRTVCLQLHERFRTDFPVLRLHSDRGGSRAFVRDTTVDKLSSRAVPCVFLGFPPDVPGWQFYHVTSRRVFASQDVTFDESVPFYHLFPYRTAPLPPPAALPRSRSPSGRPPPPSRLCSFRCVSEPEGAEPERAEPGGASLGVQSLSVWSLGVLSLRVRSLGVLSLEVLGLGVLRLHYGSLSHHSSCVSGLLDAPAFGVVLLELEAPELEALALALLVLEVFVLEVLELPGLVVLLILEELEVPLELEVLEVLELLVLEVLRVPRHRSLVDVRLSHHSSYVSGLLDAPAFGVALLELGAPGQEALELELLVLEMVALTLEALELEALEMEALALEALELEVLELDTLALETLEPEALELEALELEVLEP